MTRLESIEAGQVWQVYLSNEPDSLLFEGRKTKCLNFVKERSLRRLVKRGLVRVARVIWEEAP